MERVEPSEKLILIVDDDEDVLEFMRFSIENEGFKVKTARDGEEALKIVKKEKPDLVILDVMLPKKNAIEIARELQTDEYRDIHVIAISGRYDEDYLKDMFYFEPNVKDIFVKPVKMPILIYKIHKILNTIPKDERIVEKKKKEFEERLKPKIE